LYTGKARLLPAQRCRCGENAGCCANQETTALLRAKPSADSLNIAGKLNHGGTLRASVAIFA